MRFFDYIFYRLYKFSKDKGDNAPETNGSLLLSLMQLLTILNAMAFVRMIYYFTVPSKWTILPIAILIAVFNWYRYEQSIEVEELEKIWAGESKIKWIKNGWFIGLYFVLMFLLVILIGLTND